jgi:hypothetical protein
LIQILTKTPIDPQAECLVELSTLQSLQIEKGFNDIRYNFIIAPNGAEGAVIEGRGWEVKPDIEKEYLSIGFFTDDLNKPGENLNRTLSRMIDDGKVIGKVGKVVEIICDVPLCK